MEETPVTIPESEQKSPLASDVEKQLAALTQRLAEQLEAARQMQVARQESIEEREEALQRREWAAKARALLRSRELPESLADCLYFSSEEAVAPAIDALEEAFRAAVQQGVEARLLTSAPRTGAVVPLNQLPDEEYYAAVCRID